MDKIFKIYYNNRTIFLTDNYKTNFDKSNGLFYKYASKEEFLRFWEYFEVISSSIKNLFIIHDDVESLKGIFYESFELVDAAGGIVSNNRGELLIIKRFGKWDLPKGKLNKNEKIEHAAIREVSEECGISGLKITRTLDPTYHSYYLNNKLILKRTYWFEMSYAGNEPFSPQIEEDITEARWMNEEELDNIFRNTYRSIIDVLVDAGKIKSEQVC